MARDLPSRPPGRRLEARLAFRCLDGRTFLGAQLTPHPFHITRPFALPGDPEGLASLYLQSSSGGLYGDDDLRLSVTLEPGARLHLTTQASSVVHAGRGGVARQSCRLRLGAGAHAEYLPDPLILFPGAAFCGALELDLAPGARAILCDSFLTHDPAGAGGLFEALETTVSIRTEGAAGLIDRQCTGGADWARRCAGALATFYLAGCTDARAVAADLNARLRDWPAAREVFWGIEAMPGRALVALRLLAPDGRRLGALTAPLLPALRAALTGWDSAARRK
ncbi:urease accessory protein UreD [Paenirhodobacter hankyongi]|uniref:Urease accessory protein UreD n=1 Tax=Paenirhodobacter hankyongi TaxID=2294033 RepID=A0A421BQJ6_9RHOB|nr:urease accessory protein UreD [Sinirhodobacter hankyongi]RLL65223.1 urease accessory protein UreD [Sinirhodobacter hankyongi]